MAKKIKLIKTIETFECFICKKKFAHKLSNLRRHLAQLHNPLAQKVKCLSCNKCFQNRGNYTTHWRNYHQYPVLSKIGKYP